MRVRGTRGGITLSLDPGDEESSVTEALLGRPELLTQRLTLEVSERTSFELIEGVATILAEAGGELVAVRPPTVLAPPAGETLVVSRTIRSGAQIESTGALVVLGDVNSGAELYANDDIIVIGSLRGVAHAGGNGNEKAFIWAERILSPQLRIAGALAQSGGDEGAAGGPEVARLRDGAIVITPWNNN